MIVSDTFPYFNDLSGKALDSGFVYLGIVNQDPETNPIQVYWDAALTVPAQQPLRTLNGRIVKNGAIANIFTASSYSITVKTKTKVLIYSEPDSTTFSLSALVSQVVANYAAPSGSDLIGFLQAGFGALATTLQAKNREQVSILDFMTNAQRADYISGAATLDITSAIQAALNASKSILIPKGKGRINPVDPNYPTTKYAGGLKPQNGTVITFQGGAQLVMAATDKGEYIFWNLRDTTDVTIINGDCVGDVGSHIGVSGEFGFGYYLASATNPRLFDCKGSKFWGDGVFVGRSIETSTNPTTGGVIQNFIGDDNRRQNGSIVSWLRGMVIGGEAKNTGLTSFTSPGYGWDIEPDPDGVCQIDVTMIGVRTSGNKGGGIQIVPGFMSNNAYTRPTYNVVIDDFKSYDDGTDGALRFAYPDLANPNVNVANRVYGQISVNNPRLIKSRGRAIDFARWIPTAPKVVINDPYIEDCNTLGSVVTNENQCGIVIFVDVANIAFQTTTGTIEINNPTLVDTRAVPKMLVPIWAQTGAGQTISNLTVREASGSGWSSTANGLTRVVNANNVSIQYDTPPKIDFTVDTALVNGAFAGYSIATTVDAVISLPTVASSIGEEYLIDNRNNTTITVRPQAGDTILIFGRVVAGDIIVRLRCSRLRVKSLGGGFWQVMEAVGNIGQSGMDQPRNIYFKNALPSVGNYTAGDILFNSVPASGQPWAWARLTTGSGNVLNTDWKVVLNLP